MKEDHAAEGDAATIAHLRRELDSAQDQLSALFILLADLRQAAGVGMVPMLFDLPEVIRQRIEDGELWSDTRRDTMLAHHAWLAAAVARRPALAAAIDPTNHPPKATTVSVLLTALRTTTRSPKK